MHLATTGARTHKAKVSFVVYYAMWYNFHHIHGTLKKTPAMAAGLTDKPYSTLELMRLNSAA